MADMIRFPQERCSPEYSGTIPGKAREPCLILILPVVRIERCDDEPPLLGRRQARRVRKAIDKLRDPIR